MPTSVRLFLSGCLLAGLTAVAQPADAQPRPKQDEKDPSARECVISGGAAPWGSRGLRKAGDSFAIKAAAPAKDMVFVEWVGNVGCLADPKAAETTFTVPADWPFPNLHIGAAYQRVSKRFVHALFQDHMVIQRGTKAPIWGWTEPGTTVNVAFAGQTGQATAGPDGRWMVRMGPFDAGGPHVIAITGAGTRTINDVMIGDVWLCSGQSNMAGSGPAKEDTAQADYRNIRMFANNPGPNEYDGAQPFDDLADPKAGWVACTPEVAGRWSRVAFHFGREIHARNHIPIGLIVTALDGSFIEGWMPRGKLESMPEYLAGGRFTPDYNLSWGAGQMPYVRYNAHIAPLGPFAMRGVLWYQGESNASERSALRYRKQLALMIRDWRAVLHNDALPFVIIQMHLFGKLDLKREPSRNRESWAELQESQLLVARTIANVGCAVTVDLGKEQSLHPPDKKSISARAALVARAVAYGEAVDCYGPLFKEATIEGDKIRISFESLGGGLVVTGDGVLKPFAIAGEDKTFVWAEATIDGDTVVVSSPKVKHPVAVRYAWGSGQNEASLFNKAGLPAAPFRSDQWNDYRPK